MANIRCNKKHKPSFFILCFLQTPTFVVGYLSLHLLLYALLLLHGCRSSKRIVILDSALKKKKNYVMISSLKANLINTLKIQER